MLNVGSLAEVVNVKKLIVGTNNAKHWTRQMALQVSRKKFKINNLIITIRNEITSVKICQANPYLPLQYTKVICRGHIHRVGHDNEITTIIAQT